ncbi:protein kinase [bacterium]|nr:protein kinase [bacterium]MCI0605727.1 protein kinase [bacterium]
MLVGEVAGNYQIIRLLGRGGMGEVYLALDVRLARKVALKMISEKISCNATLLTRFRTEAYAAAALNHPNICAIYDVGEWQNRPYIAMEYVEGLTLQDMMRKTPFSVSEIVDIAIQIAEALEEARRKDVVHRDIKSSNIILTTRMQPKLLDFGLAKYNPHTELKGNGSSTHSGLVVGTVDYLSPEQARGEKVDHRSDLFSFGVVLYEALAGRRPFTGNTAADTIGALLYKDPESVTAHRPDVPTDLSHIVEKILRKDRDKRYQTAHEICIDLQQFRSQTTRSIFVPQPKATRKPALVGGVLLLILISFFAALEHNKRNDLRPIANVSKTQQQISNILVLPSKVYGSSDLQYLTDAIPSSLSTLLARVPELQTRVPPSSFDVERVKGNLSRIAEAYDVSTFALTTVSTESNRLVLNVQLVEAENRRVLWSNQYVGKLQNYIELTREAADGIRAALRPTSPPIVIASTSGLAANSGAELAYHQGKFSSIRYGLFHKPQDFDEALSAFKRALRLDPKLADAAGEIAILYYLRYQLTYQEKDIKEVENWGWQSLYIDAHSSNGWSALALLELGKAKIDTSKLLKAALKAASYGRNSSTNQVTLSVAISLASLNLSMKAAEECLRLDPLYPYAHALRMRPLIALGRVKEGLSTAKELLDIEPNLPVVLFYQSLAYSDLRQLPESKATLNALKPIVDEGRFYEDLFLIASQAYALQLGQYAEANALTTRLDSLNTAAEGLDIRAQFIAPLLVRHGKLKEALSLLTRALELNQLPHDLLVMNPDLKHLEKDPEFQQIFKRSKSNFDEVIGILKESKASGELPSYLEAPLFELINQSQS